MLLLALCSSGVMVLAPLRSAFSQQAASMEQPGLLLASLALFAQCYYWAVYGHFIGQLDIFRFNAFGAGMCLAYVLLLCRRPKYKRRRPYVMFAMTSVIVSSMFIVRSAMALASKAQACACLAMIFSFLQSTTPLLKAVEMLRDANETGFPFVIASSSFVSNVLWAGYSALVHDQMYLTSNLLNSVVGGLALTLGTAASFRLEKRGFVMFDASDVGVFPLMSRTSLTATSKKSSQSSFLSSWFFSDKSLRCGDVDRRSPFDAYGSCRSSDILKFSKGLCPLPLDVIQVESGNGHCDEHGCELEVGPSAFRTDCVRI
eukprot:TRINITY_DN26145_c0_g1_i1.p1 TRINITY_DN26145_c0_g1~~TRINITY_DN26145_c0_g1_i1.p1  ORF type:complete len:316 (-),score=44.45 TRINITY_DN26145_c0_g1_i1:86-1033(-)